MCVCGRVCVHECACVCACVPMWCVCVLACMAMRACVRVSMGVLESLLCTVLPFVRLWWSILQTLAGFVIVASASKYMDPRAT